MDMRDCVIIGGGPAGLTAAIYLARYRRRVAVLDAGRSRARLVPRSRNCPGFAEGISGDDFLAALRQQLSPYGVEFIESEVGSLGRQEDGFLVESAGKAVSARTVLLATGIRDRHPPIDDHETAVRDGIVRYCPICDGYDSADRSVCVIGPLPEAAAKARFLRSFTSRIVVAALQDGHGGDEEASATLESLGIRVRPFAPGQRLQRNAHGIDVRFADGDLQNFDVVYPAMGADVAAELGRGVGAATDATGCLIVDSHNRTDVQGLYAAGDVVADLHQIAVAVGHAALAATAIHNDLPFAPL